MKCKQFFIGFSEHCYRVCYFTSSILYCHACVSDLQDRWAIFITVIITAVNCAITFLFLVYSGTPLNEQPLTADTNDLTKILKVLNISP